MKQTGMMFKAPLVLAILNQIKLQTRRITKNSIKHPDHGTTVTPAELAREEQQVIERACPYGKPGDQIYVRETWCRKWDDQQGWLDDCWYRASNPDVVHADGLDKSPWKPSIHMPKAAARLWLEITGVRLEKLHDISREDAIAEGIDCPTGDYDAGCRNYLAKTGEVFDMEARESFCTLWQSTGADWAANPWVWVLEFKLIPTN